MNVHRERRLRPARASVNVAVMVATLAVLLGCASDEYTGRGAVVEIDADGTGITIDHDDIPGLMPAMRMHFDAPDASVLARAAPTREVRFTLARRGAALWVTSLEVLGGAPSPRPGLHDHTPHHDGVVTMIGLRHLEATARLDGVVHVYLTDVWRRPIEPDGWTGQVTLRGRGGRTVIDLRPARESLTGAGPPLAGDSVLAHVRIHPRRNRLPSSRTSRSHSFRNAAGRPGHQTFAATPKPRPIFRTPHV